MRRLLAIVAALGILQVTTVIVGAEATTSADKLPAPPRTPETGIDPGIQVHPGPSPDPRSAVAPKHNPDPGMAINPDLTPQDPSSARGLGPSGPKPHTRPLDTPPRGSHGLP